MSTVGGSLFNANGIASGLDTQTLIDSLVKLESLPITDAQNKQTAFQAQVSLIGDLANKISSLNDAATALKTNGALAVKQIGSTSAFSITPSPTATAGSYSVQVTSLATTAKSRSQAFGASDLVSGTDLTLGVNGTNYNITIADGASLDEVAKSINTSGAPVSAAVLNTNGTRYLAVSNRDAGFTPGNAASSALTITENVTGTAGKALGLAITQQATNAHVNVDGLDFERQSNTITDAIPGVTIDATSLDSAPETVSLSTDVTGTQANLQKFVDAYNALMLTVHSQLDVKQGADRTQNLSGDSTVKTLQTQLTSLITTYAGSDPNIRTLADLGIKTGDSGLLSIDSTKLTAAISNNPQAVNSIFQTANTGMADVTAALTKTFTDSSTGLLTNRKTSLNSNIKSLDDQITRLQDRVDMYRKTLVAQFTAMEQIVSTFKAAGNYLTQQENAAKSSSN